jgi:hypothetical protein
MYQFFICIVGFESFSDSSKWVIASSTIENRDFKLKNFYYKQKILTYYLVFTNIN